MLDITSESDVSIEFLKSVFDSAFCETEIDDGNVLIKTGLSTQLWAGLIHHKKYIHFQTYDEYESDLPVLDVALLNTFVAGPQIFVSAREPKHLYCSYHMTYKNGVSRFQIFLMAHRFATMAVRASELLSQEK